MTKTASERQKIAKLKLPNVITSLDRGYTVKDQHPVYLLVYLQSRRVRFITGINVKPEDWNEAEKIVMKTHPEAVDYNLIISQSRAKISKENLRRKRIEFYLFRGLKIHRQ